jgi:hypothetical protein
MKYSNFYYKVNAVAVFGLIATIFACWAQSPTIAAVLTVLTFICWYAGAMLPPCEKYRKGYKKNKGSIEL